MKSQFSPKAFRYFFRNMIQTMNLRTYVTCFLLFNSFYSQLHAQVSSDIYLPLVANVRTVGAISSPGTLRFTSSSSVPIVVGNELTSSSTAPFAVAGIVESGRFFAVAHEGLLRNENVQELDNTTLLTNAVQWLDKQQRRTAIFTTGHGEFVTDAPGSSVLRGALQQRGFTVTGQSQELTSSLLSNVGVVIIGNAWGTFTNAELTALRTYIASGGGLLLAGLGWSWSGSTPYPMNTLGSICNITWTTDVVSDMVNTRNDAPVFTSIYPTTLAITPSIDSAIAYIRRITRENTTTLPTVMQTNTDIRTQYIRSVLSLGAIPEDTTYTAAEQSKVRDFYQQLFADFPALLRKGTRYSTPSQSTMAWVREKMYVTYVNSLAHVTRTLTTEHRSSIVSALGLTGTEARIVQNYGVVNLDNSALSERQKTVIEQYLRILPARLRWLRYIMYEDFLGTIPQPAVPLYPGYTRQGTAFATGTYPIVNNFIDDIGQAPENQFPSDVEPRTVSIFSSALGHELTHNVDFNYIDKNPSLQSRLVALRQAASTNDLELLRSTVGVSFFNSSPLEFIASLANEWYTDSYHTLLLGLSRFNRNFRQPINQALYFTDVMSAGTDTTQFIATTFEGAVTAVSVPLIRDAQRRIIGLTFKDTTHSFTLNANGDVIAWQKALRGTTSITNQTEDSNINVAIHPNPVQDIVSMSCRLSIASEVQVEFVNILGQSLASLRYGTLSAGEQAFHFKIPDGIPAGMYLLRVRIGNALKIVKVMVQM